MFVIHQKGKNKMFIRPHAQFIINSMINNPEDWFFGNYTCQNRQINICLWSSNGFVFMDTDPHTGAFNLVEKWVISRLKGKTNIVGRYRRSLKKDTINEKT